MPIRFARLRTGPRGTRELCGMIVPNFVPSGGLYELVCGNSEEGEARIFTSESESIQTALKY